MIGSFVDRQASLVNRAIDLGWSLVFVPLATEGPLAGVFGAILKGKSNGVEEVLSFHSEDPDMVEDRVALAVSALEVDRLLMDLGMASGPGPSVTSRLGDGLARQVAEHGEA